jgi:hypothetical protein
LGRNIPPDDHFLACRPLEDGLDRCGLFAGTDEVSRGTSADQQADGANEDGFSRSGLPREDVQSGLELNLEAVDDGQVPNRKETQHGTRSTILSDV